ncbi:putative magnesium transporter NIPA4 [Glycine max]|nr:putative magnesium transporter NIPA4 [Glycine max]
MEGKCSSKRTEKSLGSVQEIWELAIQPAFLSYTASAIVVTLFLVLYCTPRYGQTNILVYTGICSIIGSFTVMSVKAIGIVIKLTIEGASQAFHFQTWVFTMFSVTCIIVQLNYLNMISAILFVLFCAIIIFALHIN